MKNKNILYFTLFGIGGYFAYNFLKKLYQKNIVENAIRDESGFFTQKQIDTTIKYSGFKINDFVKVKPNTISNLWNIKDISKGINKSNTNLIQKNIIVPINKTYKILSIGTEGGQTKGLKAFAYIYDDANNLYQVYTQSLFK